MRSTARRSERKKEWCVMDDYDSKAFYLEQIEILIEQICDLDLLDLVYKILLSGV